VILLGMAYMTIILENWIAMFLENCGKNSRVRDKDMSPQSLDTLKMMMEILDS